MSSDEIGEIKQVVLRLLGRREYSRHELEQKYRSRFDEVQLEQALQQLEADGYLSDSRFAEVFLRNRIAQGYGLQRIRFEFRQKGIASELLDEALEEQAPDWYTLAADAWQRKFRQPPAGDHKLYAKQMRYLTQRGFGMDESRHAIASAGRDDE
ncbi:regulatory protein RecX [Marinobacterium jannaschii]|uniref:regulatory protein RecX n=1 Tax=Marinobacterium jannaschii TaxID=64970 RepID=UPI0005611B41|nr:regulatory protein RecX [Marinobacterium jannaschii]